MVTQILVSRGMPKASQADARYTPAGGRERCGGCRHFMAPSVCNRILGPVTAAGWCRYFSQRPPQRAANFPGMGPAGASLGLNFMQPGTLDPRITFTRASTATYLDNTGTMRTAAANAPRWDYNPSTLALQGLLIEEARGNLWLQSADASNAAWVKLGTTSAAPVVTGNQAVAPDGTTTAARVVYPAVSAAGAQSLLYQLITLTAAPYVFSPYLKGSVGGEQLYLGCNAGSTHNSVRVTLTTAWQRFALPMTGTAAGWVFDIGTDLTDGAQTSTLPQTVYIWGGQVEQGTFATSYIPTTASLGSRAADSCIIPPANMGWFASPGGSWFAEFVALNPVASGRVIAYPSAGGRTPLYANATSNAGQTDGVGTEATSNAIAANAVAKAATTWTAGTATACLNAGAVASSATLTAGYAPFATAGLAFLVNGVAAENMSGYLQSFRYWPRVLTNAEIQQVTT